MDNLSIFQLFLAGTCFGLSVWSFADGKNEEGILLLAATIFNITCAL